MSWVLGDCKFILTNIAAYIEYVQIYIYIDKFKVDALFWMNIFKVNCSDLKSL